MNAHSILYMVQFLRKPALGATLDSGNRDRLCHCGFQRVCKSLCVCVCVCVASIHSVKLCFRCWLCVFALKARLPLRRPPGHRLGHRGQRRIPQSVQTQQQMHLVHHRESFPLNPHTVASKTNSNSGFFETKHNVRDLLCNYERCNNIFRRNPYIVFQSVSRPRL